MKGNFSELKNQGLDFEEILKSYENKEKGDQQIFIKEEENISKLYSDIEGNHKQNIIKEEEEELSSGSWDDENLSQTQKELDQNKIYENIMANDKKKIDIIEKEKKEDGEVKIRTWFKFFNYGLGIFGVFLIIMFTFICGISNILVNYYVGIWLKGPQTSERNKIYFNLFWGLIIILLVSATLMTMTVYGDLLISSSKLHKTVLWKLLRAPSTFFYSNPVGRILSRFSRDIYILDYHLGNTMNV